MRSHGLVTLLTAALCAAGCAPTGEAPAPGSAAKKPDPEAAKQHGRLLFDIYNRLPESPAKSEGLEGAKGWKAAGWEDPATFQLITDNKAGKSMLLLSTEGGKQGKVGAVLTGDLRLAPSGALRVCVYNHGVRTVRMAVAFWFADGWVYYESRPREAPPRRWVEMEFDLNGADYKTKSNGWKHTARLWKREETKQLALLVYHGGGPARLIIDGLTVDRAPAPKPKPKPTPKPKPKPKP
ncbi:MAG: hypothetical protein ACYTGB_12395 [Planctomycetota bacterium]|jgi:hypothetical protein